MKSIIILTIIFLSLLAAISYSQSIIDYETGTNIDVGSGADVCANYINVYGTYSGGGTFCTGPLPVEMISFNYAIRKRDVILSWETAFEVNNSGFDVERQTKEGSWQKVAFVQGNGTTNEPKQYTYEDKKLSTGKYRYRLKQVDYNGSFEYFDLQDEIYIIPPKDFSMSQNYPNPSNPKSKIDYELPINGKVTINLYNLLGQEVVQIVNEVKEAGYYTAEFDGTNLASGIYFYRIETTGFTAVKKMVIVK